MSQNNDKWQQRDLGVWQDVDEPNSFNLVPLSTNAFLSLKGQVDDSAVEPADYVLSFSEQELVDMALPHMESEKFYTRVFQALPYVDSELRSDNAKKQTRDANGRWVEVGARLTAPDGSPAQATAIDGDQVTVQKDGTSEVVNAADVSVADAPDTPKAVLPEDSEIADAPALVAAYISAHTTSASGDEPSGSQTEFADGGSVIAPTDPVEASQIQANTEPNSTPVEDSGTDDATDEKDAPLYLAEVDPQDHQAVLDLIAIIPNDDHTGIEAYKRENSTWTPAPDILAALQGLTPPTVVELTDSSVVSDVVSQIDGKPAEPAQDATDGQAMAASLVTYTLTRDEDGKLSATKNVCAVTASYFTGLEDVSGSYEYIEQMFAESDRFLRGEGKGARRLKNYWLHGEGAAKINWGLNNGSWRRCHVELGKYLGARSAGYCANLFKEATGVWPGDESNNVKKGTTKVDTWRFLIFMRFIVL